MSLHYLVKHKLEMLIAHVHWVVRESKSKIYSASTVASKFARFESGWLQRVGILRQKVYKTKHVLRIWTYWRRHWRMAAAMTIWSSLTHSVLSRCCSSSRDQLCVFRTPSLAILLTLCNQLDLNLANLEATINVE